MELNSKKYTGFSIVEILAVIVLLSILGVFFAPRIITTAAVSTGANYDQLIRDIKLTQSLSMARNERYRIIINNTSYYIENSSGSRYDHGVFGTNNISLGTGVTFSTNLTSNTLIFNGLGRPYSVSGLLSSAANIIITSPGGVTQTISVAPETGFI